MEDNDHRAAVVTVYAEGTAETLFAERLRALREAADLTQSQLAERMTQSGVAMHQTTIAKIELYQRPVRLNEAAAFAAALRVRVTDLLTDSESNPEAAALWSELQAVTSRRLELTHHRQRLRRQRMAVENDYQHVVTELEKLEHREADIRKKWHAARAKPPARRPHQPTNSQSKTQEKPLFFAPSPTNGSALAILLLAAAALWRARKNPSPATDLIQSTRTKASAAPDADSDQDPSDRTSPKAP